ncbi:very-long-chain (3R)-3-hydroxyacyl-CoA dehydratase PASTICCINO 2A [Lolium perenne]|uniref:very-long-chain (3R)-3-hydroxyacyl-CoA dehydratase PASTICCINO 2A n=1 Tax=Lolium perenne TaxID=4522 RepID=UPI0021F5AE75|nr:very-long-chain (3R)-3-hydroxyacyl-CoA dehydratase PASTICCINO 2A-like [Lolium perenne]
MTKTGSSAATGRWLYLSFYNWAVVVGWVQVLYCASSALLDSGHEVVYATVEWPLLLAQTASVMEILHWILGIIRYPVLETLPQITARLYLTWGILWSFPETRSHILVTFLIISWSINQIIGYSFFGTSEIFGLAPSWLLWLRYNTILILYPIGMISEVGLIFVATPFMEESEKYCLRMPNKWNFSFDYYYASTLLTVLYVMGFPYLFMHMVASRKGV